MYLGPGFYRRAQLKAQNLGEGVANPHAGECQYCGAWHSDLPKSGYCNSHCAQRHMAEQLAGRTMVGGQVVDVKSTMIPEKDERGNLVGVWLKDVDGVVRFKKLGA